MPLEGIEQRLISMHCRLTPSASRNCQMPSLAWTSESCQLQLSFLWPWKGWHMQGNYRNPAFTAFSTVPSGGPG